MQPVTKARHFIVKLSGGLGNQMFQYAFGLALAGRGAHVEYDLSWYGRPPGLDITPRDFELRRIFDLPLDLAEPRLVARWSDSSTGLLQQIRLRIAGRKRTHVCEQDFGGFGYHPEVLSLTSGYLDGYWQHLAYLEGADAAIRRHFTFPPVTDVRNGRYLEAIRESASVALHVRRGDFLVKSQVHPPLPSAYYATAIEHINGRIDHPRYFVFSDDRRWARENLPLREAVFVEGNDGPDAFRDMHLMSQSRHIIAANSSFSWWAAWLNPHADKVVVMPAEYARPGQLAAAGWLRLASGKDSAP